MRCLPLDILVITSFVLVWLALPALGDPAEAATATGTATAATVCTLRLEGYGTRPGLRTAQLKCTGGSITAAAHPQLLKALGPGKIQGVTQGVVWSSSRECTSDVEDRKCLLSICDKSRAVFVRPVVTHVKPSGEDLYRSLCVSDGSNVAISNGVFTDSGIRPIHVDGKTTSVVIKNSSFVRNIVADDAYGGALLVWEGHVTIRSSSFLHNKAGYGGAICASGQSKVDIDLPPGTAQGEEPVHKLVVLVTLPDSHPIAPELGSSPHDTAACTTHCCRYHHNTSACTTRFCR